MKESDRVFCEKCRNETIAQKYRAGNDFFSAVYRLRCALCGADLGEIEAPGEKKTPSSEASARLSALLGGETVSKVEIERGDGYRRGCRNCRHFIHHPFKAICDRTGKEADPMHECGFFEFREKEK